MRLIKEDFFFLPFKLPGANECVGRNWRAYNRLKKKTQEAILLELKRHHGLNQFKKARLEFTWVVSNKKRDPDNIMFGQKFILDALVNKKVLAGDGWSVIKGISHHFHHDAELAVDGVNIWIWEI